MNHLHYQAQIEALTNHCVALKAENDVLRRHNEELREQRDIDRQTRFVEIHRERAAVLRMQSRISIQRAINNTLFAENYKLRLACSAGKFLEYTK